MTLFRRKRVLQSGGILLVLVLFLFTGLASVPKAYAESVTVSGVSNSATVGVPFSGTIATVSDPAATDPSQLTVQIDWGDGTTTAGTVSGSGGSFTVTGTHTYTSAGTFTFTVTVTDTPTGVTASGSGTASVHDVTAPALSLPGTITKDATSPQGVVVTYTVTATDPDNPASQLTISCSPVSGSTFPIGTMTVNCTASDPAGNTASGSFQVVVEGAAQQTSDLISLVNSFHLSKSLQTALDNKLQDVLTAITAGQTATACSELTDFIGFVQSHTGKGISTSQAKQLIAAAQQIQAVLGC